MGKTGGTEHSKGNQTVPTKMVTTRTKDGHGIPKQALQYRPKGRRNIERPRKRWKDNFVLRNKEQETRLTLLVHDDDGDDDDDEIV